MVVAVPPEMPDLKAWRDTVTEAVGAEMLERMWRERM